MLSERELARQTHQLKKDMADLQDDPFQYIFKGDRLPIWDEEDPETPSTYFEIRYVKVRKLRVVVTPVENEFEEGQTWTVTLPNDKEYRFRLVNINSAKNQMTAKLEGRIA